MTITSLSLAFVQFGSTATTAPKPAATAPAPAPAPAAPACEHHGCDSARRSPLFRALMEVLGSMVQQAQPPAAAAGTPAAAATPAAPAPAPAATTSPAAATSSSATAASTEQPTAAAGTAAAAPSTEQPVDLDEAVLNFARALMQALRGRHDDGGSEGEGHGHGLHHGHRHHDHARMGWGDPAQRVEQLGAQLSAPAPAMTTDTCAPGMTNDTGAPAMATNTSAAAPARAAAPAADIEPAASTAPSDTVLDPVRAVDVAAGRSQATMIYVKFSTDSSTAGAPRLNRTQQGLLDAFGTLQQAMGSTHNDPAASLKAQLSAFLQNLAEKLRAGDVEAAGNTQPGNLLHVMA